MGIYDRDYTFRNTPARRPSRLGMLSANTWLIIANVAVFMIDGFSHGLLTKYGYFSTATVGPDRLEFWRFVTFQFLHANVSHIFFNMLGLYMFGSLVEQFLGRRKYLAFYLTCGVAGALMYLILNALGVFAHNHAWPRIPGLLLYDTSTPLVGASAGVFGVVMACAYISPNTQVQLLFPPIPMRMKTLAYGYFAITVISLFFGNKNQGGEAAHVGGALAGFFFIRNSHLLRDFFDVFTDSRKAGRQPTHPRGEPPNLRLVSDAENQEIDRILEKIRQQGQESLTPDEIRVLKRATDRARTGRG